MLRWRAMVIVVAVAILGLVTSFVVACVCGWWPARVRADHTAGIMYFIQVGDGYLQYQVEWRGGRGRDSVVYRRVSPGDGQASLADFRRSYFAACSPEANPDSTFTVEENRRKVAALFPDWAAWAAAAPPEDPLRHVFASGFPFRAFYGQASQISRGGPYGASSGVLALDSLNPGRALPYMPLGWGTAANTIIFALPWAVVVGIGPTRRWLRLRRGHCPFCNYDLRSDFSRVCSECGRRASAGPRPEGEA